VALGAPVLPDAKPGDGPLQAAVSACRKLRGERIALLAGDLPYLTAEALLFLRVAWQPGDEAVVAEHDGRFEPLAALYDRAAVLREGVIALRHGERSMQSLLQRIRKRTVRLPASLLVNVNSPHELPASKPA
jgi:molybdopterin-guanine dinucleotide biosynthesis protein A